MEEIRCIFCDVESDDVVIEENGFKGRRCPRCGLIYVSPRPSFGEIVDLYGHDDARISADSHIASAFPKRLYARHHLGLIRSLVRGGALLEIGAGAGYFLDEARRIGFDPYGLEFNPIQARFIKDTLNIPCEESPLSTSVFGGRRFDMVYHCDVISHFFDPISDFRTTNQVMKPGAFLVFETGNLAEVDPVHLKHIQRFQYPDHLFFFSAENLRTLLEMTGFRLLRLYRYSIMPQLRLIRLRPGMRRGRAGPPKQKKNSLVGGGAAKPAGSVQPSSSGRSTGRRMARNLLHYVEYLFRYKIGCVAPKKGRPQTVIVIAQKTGDA